MDPPDLQTSPFGSPSRRGFLKATSAAVATVATPWTAPQMPAAAPTTFKLNYILASSMYGYTGIETILPEVAKTSAGWIDIWPKVHGNQREQLDELGEERFARMLQEQQVRLGCLTQYKLGPFRLQDEIRLAQRLGCPLIVTEGAGPKGLTGSELKSAVQAFIEKLKPTLELAQQCGVTIAIENHANNLIESPDSMKWLMELASNAPLGIAFAPYHLPQDEKILCELIRVLGNRIKMFYAWQHGNGCMQAQPKEQELLQMPGRGPLDFRPIIKTLEEIEYTGFTEIFMHPFPRGIPILETTDAVTREINQSRQYLENCLKPEGNTMSKPKVLIIVGDATETLDTMYPYYRLIEAGFEPVVAGPEKRTFQMVLHEVKPGWTITKEWEGYTIEAKIAFKDVVPQEYAGIMFSGGRAPEYIRYDEHLVKMTKHFFETNKPIACVCHGVEIPAYADCVRGRKMATVPKCKFDLEVCGGIYVNEACVIDGNLFSGRTFHDNGAYIGPWIAMLEAQQANKPT